MRSKKTWGTWGGRLLTLAAIAVMAGSSPAEAKKVAPEGTLTGGITSALTSTLRTAGSVIAALSRVVNGTVGGALTSNNWTLEVPAGAFSGSATITMQEMNASDGSPTVDLTISDPSLNNFSNPVQLKFRTTSSDARVYWWDPVARVHREVPGQSVTALPSGGYELSAPLYHFSEYSVRGGRAGW